MSKWALPSGYLNTASVSLSRQITATSGLPVLSLNSSSHHHTAGTHHRSCGYELTLSLLHVRHMITWFQLCPRVSLYVLRTVGKNGQPEAETAHDDFTRGEETKRDETRDGKEIRSGLSRASSHFPLLAYCQSDHMQMGETWAGNKLLINNYLNEGKCIDVTPLCPASTYFPTPLLSPRFRIFCKTFTARWIYSWPVDA